MQAEWILLQRYHADNGIFKANKWVLDCSKKDQNLKFASVNAHHQNGEAERRIRYLQELTRTQMIHVAYKWKAIKKSAMTLRAKARQSGPK